ncbi:hypothetical protein E2C01_025115 [Portunus trituberculatus]|uniref:Uncharacterized protein n=1 Tax=Portunus trituberculatus TaxID=210409 RepID=A0A5B7EE79_PORTR|nr:hypothetical protein [Portunus trituberculatus]
MSPGIVLCGYHRCGSWPVFLKKAQVRQRTAGCLEGWTPEAARRVGMSNVMMARVEIRECSAVWEELQAPSQPARSALGRDLVSLKGKNPGCPRKDRKTKTAETEGD